MKHVFQRQALEEYREATAYIAQTSKQNSILFIQRVEAAIEYILKHPDSKTGMRSGCNHGIIGA